MKQRTLSAAQKLWIGLSLIAFFLIGGVTGGYFLYQHRLSGDVKRLLIAANDEHASEMEVRQYVAQARPLVRTQKDKEVFGQFEKAISLFASIEEDQRIDAEELRETMRSISRMVEGEDDEGDECMGGIYRLRRVRDQYSHAGLKAPKDLIDHIQTAYQDGKECRARKKQDMDARTAREKSNHELALKTMNSVRVSLGLPIIPQQQQH